MQGKMTKNPLALGGNFRPLPAQKGLENLGNENEKLGLYELGWVSFGFFPVPALKRYF